MKRSRFRASQIAAMLKEGDAGVPAGSCYASTAPVLLPTGDRSTPRKVSDLERKRESGAENSKTELSLQNAAMKGAFFGNL